MTLREKLGIPSKEEIEKSADIKNYMALTELLEPKLEIERLNASMSYAPGRGGYRFHDNFHYAFVDVYWQKVSGHYLILTRDRFKQHFKNRPIKPINGPYAIEILEPETSEEAVERRCLEILKEKIRSDYPKAEIEVSLPLDLMQRIHIDNK